jgi:two-component system response regulator HydG
LASPTATILCLDGDAAVLRAIPPVVDGRVLTIESPAPSENAAGMDPENGAGSAAVRDVAAVVALARRLSPAAILLPLEDADGAGLDALLALRTAMPDVPVIVLAARGSMTLTIAAIQAGAYDLLPRPPDPLKLRDVLARGLAGPGGAARPLPAEAPEDELTIVGESEAIVGIYKTIGRVASSSATLLVVGESGTGKELVARVVHRASPRSAGPFLAVNCAAIPENLLESELFGHEKGAFTGAVGRKTGKFERAQGGTLFLDEIGDMSLALQSKILRVLQEREVERVGGAEKVAVDVRVIAATNRDLQRDVRSGRFREDLYFRLAVVTVALPPLRERRGDIPLLVDCFTRRFAGENRKPVDAVSRGVHALLERHPWPGNIRQLRNALERAVIMCQGRTLLPEHLPPELFETAAAPSPAAADGPLPTLEEVERRHIQAVLLAAEWNMSRAAEILGIHRNTLRRRSRELGLGRSELATR